MKRLAILLVLFSRAAVAQAPKELKPVFEVAGQDSGALLGNYVKGIGDLNKDGYADVAVSASGQLRTYVYYGGKTMSQTPSLIFEGGGAIVSGDFNGDGWTDLAIEKYFRDTVLVYFGGAQMDTIPDALLHAENRYDAFGRTLREGDVNGDGITDLVITASAYPYTDTVTGSYWRGKIYVYSGGTVFDTIPRATIIGDTTKAGLGYDLAVGDVNKDGKKDIIGLGYNQLSSIGTEQYYYFSVFLGDSSFQLRRNYCIDSRQIAGGFKHHIACFDADGDGIDDILVNKIYIFKGGAQLDTIPTYYVPPPNNDTSNFGAYPWVSGGGDFNRDRFKDILLSRTEGYFGGVPGVFVHLNRLNHPGQYVAYRVWSGCCGYQLYGRPENAGDVNGDGVDDIIVGAPLEPSFYVRGFFGIYSGDTTLVTGVNEPENTRPGTFELKQNYPNPFNPETTIEYTLQSKDKVILKIFDSLGREVTTLVHQEQPAGEHIVRWNGTNSDGERVASGIYYYQLHIGSNTETKKAIYLK